MGRLRLALVALGALALLATIPTAGSGSHGAQWWSGQWSSSFGGFTLRHESDQTGQQLLEAIGGTACTEPTDYFAGNYTAGSEAGVIRGCTVGGPDRLKGRYRNTGGSVTGSFDVTLFSPTHWTGTWADDGGPSGTWQGDFLGHFAGDGAENASTTPPPEGEPPPGPGDGGEPPPPPIREDEESIPAPDAGESAKVPFVIDPESSELIAILTGVCALPDRHSAGSEPSSCSLEGTGVAITEKARKLKKLEGVQNRLETHCTQAFGTVGLQPDWLEVATLDLPPAVASLTVACVLLLAELQKHIDDLKAELPEGQRAPHGADEMTCEVVSFRLRSEKRGGKQVVKLVKKGTKPRLTVGCEATDAGLELSVARRGEGTLREAIGKNLNLTVRRSDAAPALPAGTTLTISVTQT
jgi:hypothetical protein